MEVNAAAGERERRNRDPIQQPAASKARGRLPHIILTYSINLLNYQGDVRTITVGSFEFRVFQNGTRVMTK
jgi:hypothetical protein